MNTTEAEQKPTLLQQMGGVSGLIYASIPSIVFVAADAAAGLHVAVALAVGAGAGIALLRLVRKEPVQPALSGLLGVAIAAFIAYQTGEAKDYFLVGIWASFVLMLLFAASVVVRRPLVGIIWAALSGRGPQWRAHSPSRFAYDIATVFVAAVFAARFVVQNWLYDTDSTGWLAVARIAMGYPLTALALVVVVWAVRRSDRQLSALTGT
ncbi:membrane protein [Mycolicibacterium murale]|jgi:hypothetical protein|uniref:Membrane protein n=1 Tax=Mycolicibacterium murale TaxID=182220 RepID=A0A7I9WPK1_9MYCO|nr:DUF3159 domain-containing protein [Mycolicibacterium murale]MCV7184400.1 DUF3159 domain-containing protein [Mycolicibacterium murale]GFG59290.1 membrane protein [Mycolicibacterium murale]